MKSVGHGPTFAFGPEVGPPPAKHRHYVTILRTRRVEDMPYRTLLEQIHKRGLTIYLNWRAVVSLVVASCYVI